MEHTNFAIYFTLHLSTVMILNSVASMIIVLLMSGRNSFKNIFKGCGSEALWNLEGQYSGHNIWGRGSGVGGRI